MGNALIPFHKTEIITTFANNKISLFDMDLDSIDKTFIRKGKIKQQGNDFLFWQSQPYEVRLAAIEQIRTEYNTWKYGTEQGFQRVYRIIKRK